MTEAEQSTHRDWHPAIASKPWTASYDAPLRARCGDSLRIEQRVSEWEDWTWCVNADGIGGWVPNLLFTLINGRAHLLCDYDAAEITVAIGDTLLAGSSIAGWVVCRDRHGAEGWLPLDCVSDSRQS